VTAGRWSLNYHYFKIKSQMVMVEDITVFNNRSRDVQMILKEKEDN
jgi:hypothetical protein